MANKTHNHSFLMDAATLANSAKGRLDKAKGDEGGAIALAIHGLVTAWRVPLTFTVLSKQAGGDSEDFTDKLDGYRFPKLKDDGSQDRLHRGAFLSAIMVQLFGETLDAKGKARAATYTLFNRAFPAAAHIVTQGCKTEWNEKDKTFTVVSAEPKGAEAAKAIQAIHADEKKGIKAFSSECRDQAIECGKLAAPASRAAQTSGGRSASKGVVSTREMTPTDLFRVTRDTLKVANDNSGEAEMAVAFTSADVELIREMVEQASLFLEAEANAKA